MTSINHTEMITWAKQVLRNQGYDLQLAEEIVIEMPWSVVIRFSTKQGNVYLKQTPPSLFIEANILTMLRDECHVEPIPELIESNKALHCFLMKDAGRPLREILKQHFDTALLCKAIEQFASIQLAVVDQITLFLDLGVPDWRLDKMPDLYKQLLSQKALLIADGLSEIEISELEALLPIVSNLCKKLSGFSIKQTMTQCDFHDNNILIDELSQAITIIDLGEIVISHPFFSMVGCLRQIKKHHTLTDEDDTCRQLMVACLKNYKQVESEKQLLDAFAVTRSLWFVYDVLAQHRLMVACGKAKLMPFQQGKLSASLRAFNKGVKSQFSI